MNVNSTEAYGKHEEFWETRRLFLKKSFIWYATITILERCMVPQLHFLSFSLPYLPLTTEKLLEYPSNLEGDLILEYYHISHCDVTLMPLLC